MISYAFIFARGGSKRVINKNIRLLAGKPLIVHAINLAKSIKSIDKVFVSTEDKEISKFATESLVEVIPRPTELAQDDAPELLAWQHAIRWVQNRYGSFDVFVSLPTTAPLRTDYDVDSCLRELEIGVDVVITVTESSRNPWFNMVSVDEEGEAKLFLSDGSTYTRGQDAPKVFDMTTVAYVSRPDFIVNADTIFSGKVRAVSVPPERSIDIDTELDLKIAECLFSNT